MNFSNLFRYHYRPLCIYAIHFVKDVDLAEDLVQGAFETLWMKVSEGDEVRSPKSYLYTMVKNRCLDHLRRGGAQASSLEGVEAAEPGSEVEPSGDEAEVRARLWTAIDTLPPKCREVLLLSKRDGLSQNEIAAELGISLQTVKNHLTKAMKTLRDGAVKIYMLFMC